MGKMAMVMAGGCVGAACRYGVGLLSVRLAGGGFPWGTLAVNLAGCFLIGLVFGLAERVLWLTPAFRLFIVTGFLGAFTTFSSFAVETVNAANGGSLRLAVFNVLLNNVGGLLLVLLGMRAAQAV